MPPFLLLADPAPHLRDAWLSARETTPCSFLKHYWSDKLLSAQIIDQLLILLKLFFISTEEKTGAINKYKLRLIKHGEVSS